VPAPIDRRRWLAAALLVPCVALAQSTQLPQWPSPEDMARALKARPFPTPERIEAQPTPEVPRIQSNPLAPGTIDIAGMARQGAVLSSQPPPPENPSALRIFITLDMPRGSLQRLVDQAARSGAVLVMRGLKAQSLRATLAAVSELIETRRVAWVIDPDAFTRFRVASAPTFVLTLADEAPTTAATASADASPPQCGNGCAMPTAFVSVAGDVSLDYALEAILRRSPEAAPRATAFLQRLRRS
jgi:conjugal transfer pilus assembly protein TrbC